MRLLAVILFILLIVGVSACLTSNNSDHALVKDPITVATCFPEPELTPWQKYDSLKLEETVDSIWYSPKVQELQQELDEQSEGLNELIFVFSNKGDDQILLQVEEKNRDSSKTHFTFSILPHENWKIYFFDELNNGLVDFSVWCDE